MNVNIRKIEENSQDLCKNKLIRYLKKFQNCTFLISQKGKLQMYRGADKSLAQPARKQATATEDFDVHISYLLS